MSQRLGLMLLICLPLVGCDQLTKLQAVNHLIDKGRLSYFGDIFRLEYAINTGAWGGMGGQLPEFWRQLLLTGAVGVFLLGLILYIVLKSHPNMVVIALSLVLSGGLGNLIDRAWRGYVVDFLNIGIGPVFRTNIFNVADMVIMAGAGLLILFYLLHKEEDPNQDRPIEADAA